MQPIEVLLWLYVATIVVVVFKLHSLENKIDKHTEAINNHAQHIYILRKDENNSENSIDKDK